MPDGRGGDYTVDPDQLRSAARKWAELSEAVAKASGTPQPTSLGLVPAHSVTKLSTGVNDQSSQASQEFGSISERLLGIADNYAGTEQFNVGQAKSL